MEIERAIGLLKIRIKILLDCLPLTDVKKTGVYHCIYVLHNICILKNDVMPIAVCVANEEIGPINHGDIAVMGNE